MAHLYLDRMGCTSFTKDTVVEEPEAEPLPEPVAVPEPVVDPDWPDVAEPVAVAVAVAEDDEVEEELLVVAPELLFLANFSRLSSTHSDNRIDRAETRIRVGTLLKIPLFINHRLKKRPSATFR